MSQIKYLKKTKNMESWIIKEYLYDAKYEALSILIHFTLFFSSPLFKTLVCVGIQVYISSCKLLEKEQESIQRMDLATNKQNN